MNISNTDYLERIADFCLMDDEFMTKYFEDNIEATELVLRIILGQPDLELSEMHTQHIIKNLQGHSIQMDIMAIDSAGQRYDVEVQNNDEGADAHRARYNSSILDANMLMVGEKYRNLKDNYVIFITENDVLGKGKAIYHINRTVNEASSSFGDGSNIIYMNGKYRVRYFKRTQGGVDGMSRIMEEMCAEVAKRVRIKVTEEVTKEVTKEKAYSTAQKLFLIGKLTIEEIASCVGLSVDEVKAMRL